MSPITVTTDVDRPAEEVFTYATDPSRFKEWQAGVVDGRLDADEPVGVGARCITTRQIGGAQRAATSVVTDIDPPHTWGVRGVDGPIRAAVQLTVEPLTPAKSRLTIAVDFDGHGIGKVLVPLLVRRQAQKEMPTNLARLKECIESGQPRPVN
jgi:uncharacterized protein YndB with AHSA1/START domain